MEPESVTNHTASPVKSSERYAILDVLRGLAPNAARKGANGSDGKSSAEQSK